MSPSAPTLLDRFCKLLELLIALCLALCLALMVLMVFGNVVLRYVLISGILANKFFEVQKHMVLSNHPYNPQSMIFSKKV